MSGVQSLPAWAVALTAVAAAGVYIWRWISLMATWKQKASIFRVAAVTGALIAVLAGIEHNTVNHALVLFADVMLGFTAATLPLGQKLKSLSRVSAQTGVQQALPSREAKVFALFYLRVVEQLRMASTAPTCYHQCQAAADP